MNNIYSYSRPVVYRDFVAATSETFHALAAGMFPNGYSVRVQTCGGTTASIRVYGQKNGSQHFEINMPTMSADARLSAGHATRLIGFLIHEASHALFTGGMDSIAANIAQVARQFSTDPQQLFATMNGLEDYHIERLATCPARPMAGNAPTILGQLNDELLAPNMVASIEAAPDAATKGRAYVLSQINRHGRQTAPAMDAQADAARAATPDDVRELVDATLDRLDQDADATDATPHCKRDPVRRTEAHRGATFARMHIAANLLVALQRLDAQAAQDKADQDQEGKGSDDNSDDAQPNNSDDAQPNGGEEGEEGTSNGAKDDDDDTDAQPNGAGQGGGPMTADELADPKAHAAKADTEAKGQQGKFDGATSPAQIRDPKSQAEYETLQRNRVQDPRDLIAQSQKAMIDADARGLADAVRRGLNATDLITTERRLQSGRLDRRAITRQTLGAPDVFQRRTHTPAIKTAVTIMLDASSSMNAPARTKDGTITTRWHLALGAIAAMAPGIERSGADLSIYSFAQALTKSGNGFSSLTQLKGFAGRLNAQRFLDRNADRYSYGSTPMSEETLFASRQLLARKQVTRRVCLWLCDGVADDVKAAKFEVRRARIAGVEHYGIGLDTSDPADVFGADQCAIVWGMVGLPDAVERMLLGTKARAAA